MSMIKDYLNELAMNIAEIPENKLQDIIDTLKAAQDNDKKLFLMGNGGSASTSTHLACDLQKGVKEYTGNRFKVISLADSMSLITAWSNDNSYDCIFEQQLDSLADEGDVVIAISGSGNSANVLKAVELANKKGLITIGFSGYKGGKLAEISQKSIVVNSDNMQRIEDVHLILGHIIFTVLRDAYGRKSDGCSCCK